MGAGSREQGAESREQGAESREQGAGSREQRAGSREQRAGSREQRAEDAIVSPQKKPNKKAVQPLFAAGRHCVKQKLN